MENIGSFIQNCEQANYFYHLDRNKSIMLFQKIAYTAFKQPNSLIAIPDKDAATVGEAFLNLLDAIDDESLFQTLSTLGYYFLSRGIDYNAFNYQALNKRIIILNLGARSFYKTIAKAKRLPLPHHVDFNNWMSFPSVVKLVLVLEYRDIEMLSCMVKLPDDVLLRKEWLESAVSHGYFNDICLPCDIIKYATTLHNDVMEYLDRKVKKGVVYFVD